jgi:hypothetical protein
MALSVRPLQLHMYMRDDTFVTFVAMRPVALDAICLI